MLRWEKQIAINAGPEKVIDYVADIGRHPEWTSRPMEAKQTSQGPVAVGATFATMGKQFGKHTDEVKITELVPGSRVAFESRGDAGVVQHWFDAKPSGKGTTLVKGVDFVTLKFPTKLFSGVIRKLAPKDLEACLAKIKSNLESGS